MTLPASGAISLGQVATELGIALPLSLGDSRVLSLAGKSGLPISLSDLYGKSAYTPVSGTGHNAMAGNYPSSTSSGTASASPYVTPSGGTGSYTYTWTITSVLAGATPTLTNPNSSQCTLSQYYPKMQSGSFDVYLQCVISDGRSSITISNIEAMATWGTAY